MDSLPFNITRTKIIVTLSAIVVLFLGLWVYRQSFIDVTITPVNDAETTVTIIDQESGEATQEAADGDHYRRRVPRGNYEVVVEQDSAGAMAIVSTGSFFSATHVELELQHQNTRTPIAHGSLPCVNETDSTLVSWECNNLLENARVHIPATADQPTYKRRIQGVGSWVVESVSTINGDRYALIRLEAHDDGGFLHGIYPFTNDHNIDVGGGRILNDLSSDGYYQLHSHKDGFAVLSETGESAYYYQGVSDENPETIAVPRPESTNGLRMVEAHFGEHISVLYADELLFPPVTNNWLRSAEASTHEEEEGEPDTKEYRRASFVSSNDAINELLLPPETTSATLCGAELLCARVSGDVVVYRVDGDETSIVGRVTGVDKLLRRGDNQLWLSRENTVVRFSPETMTGTHAFATKGEMCGAESGSQQSLLVCARQNPGGENTIFRLDPTETTSRPIDHKLAELRSLDEVRQITAQGKFVYVSPEVGELVRDSVTGDFRYDPKRVHDAAQAIDEKVASLGLEEDGYQVINTIPE